MAMVNMNIISWHLYLNDTNKALPLTFISDAAVSSILHDLTESKCSSQSV